MNLSIERLTKRYGSKIAVNELSLDLKEGVYGLLGANGAGKTTLMRMICGVLTPTSGKVELNGKNTISMGEDYRDLIGYLPQNFGYYPDFTAKEFMLYIASLKGLIPSFAKNKTKELLSMVGLDSVSNKKIRTFSGGMKQRLGIAQAVLNDPKILVLDEPTAGLDPKERVRFRNLISDLSKNKIIILSTHIVSDVEYIADEILIMKNGNIISQNSVDGLIKEIENSVWKCTISESEEDYFCNKYCIVNLQHNRNGSLDLRIISRKKPIDNAANVPSSLEDLYLYHFQDNLKN
ncbi:ABC transporter ATP-binding protein [Clostridium sporogenes]|jgi:ABC-2 type transport system ATP-binding protein|uniref:ABC transporter ATP-binding protein n=2 Tax=Clostridium TaxID=1485 RepID=A0A0D0ZVE7_CLOBO|nr:MULTISPECIES: ABC transporter ATP-binding protein [Clostridium]MBE6077256.1 ABC transporter ATP-binding protein [Clostridium lundense]MDU2832304.1 ABC transporter ATP-binding protein [Clostridium botulinum]KIS22613.1 ABC transporter ATP-binding protein [Clostridium botulinum B2 450]MCW6092610.1 ABC transporter ATP-binding protein [Clostridium sporogenes]MCW7998185.1 ABC transporter ATP-binding protein [Clostridium sp. cpc1]